MELTENIRARRLTLGLTLESLAERSGVSRAMLSEVERGLKNPTIKVVCQIAEALGCSVSQLLGEESPSRLPEGLKILRREERQSLLDPRSGVERHLLSPAFLRRGLEVLWYIIPPGQDTGTFPPHQSGVEENITVVEGELHCRIDNQNVILRVGDSIFFRANTAHGFSNPGSNPCTYFLVIDSSRAREPQSLSFTKQSLIDKF